MSGINEQVQTVFSSFDKDNSGYLEREEIDLNKDGKISLAELNDWWYSKKNGQEQILWLKMKSVKLSKIINAGVEIWGGFYPCDADHVQHTRYWHVGKCMLLQNKLGQCQKL